jgi:hypothetical protein
MHRSLVEKLVNNKKHEQTKTKDQKLYKSKKTGIIFLIKINQ